MPVVPLYHSPSVPQPVGSLARARHISTGLRIPLSQVGRASQARAEALNRMASQVKSQASQAARTSRLVGREMARREQASARNFRFFTDTLGQLTGFGARLAAALQTGKTVKSVTNYNYFINRQEDAVEKKLEDDSQNPRDYIQLLSQERMEERRNQTEGLDNPYRFLFNEVADRTDLLADSRLREKFYKSAIDQANNKIDEAAVKLYGLALQPGRSVEQVGEYSRLFDAAMDAATAAGLMSAEEAGQRKVKFHTGLLADKINKEIETSFLPPDGGPSQARQLLARLEGGEFNGRLDSDQTLARLTEAARRQTNREKRESLSQDRAARATARQAPQRLDGRMEDDIQTRLLTGQGHRADYAAILAAQGRNDAAADYLAKVKAAEWAHDWLAARQDAPLDSLTREARATSALLAASLLAQDQLTGSLLGRATELFQRKLAQDPRAALDKPIQARLKAMIQAGEVDSQNPGSVARALAEAAGEVQARVGLPRPRILTQAQAGELKDFYLHLKAEERPGLLDQVSHFGPYTGRVLAEAGLDDEVALAGDLLARPQSRQAGRLALAGYLAAAGSDRRGPSGPSPATGAAQALWAETEAGRIAALAAGFQAEGGPAVDRARSLWTTVGNLAAEYNRRGLSVPAAARAAAADMAGAVQPLAREGRSYLLLPAQADPDRAAAELEASLSRLPLFTARVRADYIGRAAALGRDPNLAAWEFDADLDRLAQTGVWVNVGGPGLPQGRAVFLDSQTGRPVSDHRGRPFTVTLARTESEPPPLVAAPLQSAPAVTPEQANREQAAAWQS